MNCYRSPTFEEATPTYRVSTNISTPVLCVVAAQLATVDGNRDANNQTFISNSITECELRVNNVAYPREKLETNFTAGQVDVARSYQMLLDWKNKHADQENGTLFSVIDYANTFPMFVFDLNNVEKGVFSADGNCDISFKCRMDGNTAVQFTFLILSESEAVISSNGSQISLERL
jgi:hypothetical protein